MLFHYNIRTDNMLGIGYIAVICIPCSCYKWLSKLASPWNIRQDKYNQDQQKGENQECVYCPILGSYNNYLIIHFIDSKKQHEATNSDVNVHIKKHAIRYIAFKTFVDISDKGCGAIYTIDIN